MNFVNFKSVMMVGGIGFSLAAAQAQQAPTDGQGVLSPPPEVTNVISIDAHNAVLIETQNPDNPNEPKEYTLAVPKHIYSGAIARIFGGTIIPTETLVIPQSAMRSNMGAPGGFGGFSGFNGVGNNAGNNNFNSFGRGFPTFAPRVSVNNLNQFNQVFGYLDQPIRQAEVGVGFSDTTNTNNSNFGVGYNLR